MTAHVFDTKTRAIAFADRKNKKARKYTWVVIAYRGGEGWLVYARRK